MICEHNAAYWAEDAKIEFAVSLERRMGVIGMQRKDFAAAIDSSPAYVTKLLRGDANLTIESMAKIAHALDARLHIHMAPVKSQVKWFEVIASKKDEPDSSPKIKAAWSQVDLARHEAEATEYA